MGIDTEMTEEKKPGYIEYATAAQIKDQVKTLVLLREIEERQMEEDMKETYVPYDEEAAVKRNIARTLKQQEEDMEQKPGTINYLTPKQVKEAQRDPGLLRQFDTGATRDIDTDKYDYEGFLSPLVLEAYAIYMSSMRVQADGSVRDSDNWQKGIPMDAYMKSMWRHFFDVWKYHRKTTTNNFHSMMCGLMFNVMGYYHEWLKEHPDALDSWKTYAADLRDMELEARRAKSG